MSIPFKWFTNMKYKYHYVKLTTKQKQELRKLIKLPYRFEMWYSKEDKCWFIRYPDLRGCMADGKTIEKAIASGNEAKELWLGSDLEHGIEPPQPTEVEL